MIMEYEETQSRATSAHLMCIRLTDLRPNMRNTLNFIPLKVETANKSGHSHLLFAISKTNTLVLR